MFSLSRSLRISFVIGLSQISLAQEPPYFVMKLLGGHTLSEHLKKRPILPRDPETLDDLLSVFVKVCDAVAFAHSKSGLHLPTLPKPWAWVGLSAYARANAGWLEQLYDKGLNALPTQSGEACESAVCHRISFMYALLYRHSQLNLGWCKPGD